MLAGWAQLALLRWWVYLNKLRKEPGMSQVVFRGETSFRVSSRFDFQLGNPI